MSGILHNRNKIEQPLLSIIVPVYNSEKYIEGCISSIISQSYTNFEVICVNDGSTDNSLSILNALAQKDERIIVINQKNSGVSAARNNGISAANGDYILFCDSDDSFKPNLCSEVASIIKRDNADVVMFAHDNYVDGNFYNHELYFIKNANLKKRKSLIKNQIYVWEKAFKKTFLKENNIFFPIGIKNAEDVVFCLLTYLAGAKFSVIKSCLYNYSLENEGCSTFTNPNGIKNDIEAYKYLISTKFYQDADITTKLLVTNRFIGGSVIYYKTLMDTLHEQKLLSDLRQYISVLKEQFSTLNLISLKNYRRMCKILLRDKYKKFIWLFDIKTTKTTKTIVIFGMSFTFNRGNKK